MTDQPKLDLDALTTAVDEFGQNLATAARTAWGSIKIALDTTQHEFVLAPDPVRFIAKMALAALLDQDDEEARQRLTALDDASALRHRGRRDPPRHPRIPAPPLARRGRAGHSARHGQPWRP